MKTRRTVTISLPPEMAEQMEEVRKTEHRSRSELVREALRFYLLPAVKPTARELRGVQKGRAEIRRGHYVTLDQLHAELDRLNLLERSKERAPGATRRARVTRRRARRPGRRSSGR